MRVNNAPERAKGQKLQVRDERKGRGAPQQQAAQAPAPPEKRQQPQQVEQQRGRGQEQRAQEQPRGQQKRIERAPASGRACFTTRETAAATTGRARRGAVAAATKTEGRTACFTG